MKAPPFVDELGDLQGDIRRFEPRHFPNTDGDSGRTSDEWEALVGRPTADLEEKVGRKERGWRQIMIKKTRVVRRMVMGRIELESRIGTRMVWMEGILAMSEGSELSKGWMKRKTASLGFSNWTVAKTGYFQVVVAYNVSVSIFPCYPYVFSIECFSLFSTEITPP